jgi:hypothetical protein
VAEAWWLVEGLGRYHPEILGKYMGNMKIEAFYGDIVGIFLEYHWVEWEWPRIQYAYAWLFDQQYWDMMALTQQKWGVT